MIGSGPYRFIAGEYNSGSRVVYEKFDAYQPRQEAPSWTSGAKIAHFRRIEWHILPDPATAAGALASGEVDWLDSPLPDLIGKLADPATAEAALKTCEEIDRLESDADRVMRSAMSKLFREEPDVREVLKLKAIYELLETITDKCEDVANQIEGIVLENS